MHEFVTQMAQWEFVFNAPWFLDNVHWLEDHQHVSQKELATFLHCGEYEVRVARAALSSTRKGMQEVERQTLRDLNGQWATQLLARGLGRSARTLYSWAVKLDIQASSGYRKKGFWPAWRGYVQDHLEDFWPISRRIVIRPRQITVNGRGCETCRYLDLECSYLSNLPCENTTLWDAVGRRAECLQERSLQPPRSV